MIRFVAIEITEFFARPVQWIVLVAASLVVLAGVNQLDLDRAVTKVLIIDNAAGQSEGWQIEKLVKELSGVAITVRASFGNFEQLIDQEQPDIVLAKSSEQWKASLRPRSILEHRRLSRTGFAIAAIINRQTPWETVISAESSAPKDFGRMICEHGVRICSVYRSAGHPKFNELCIDPRKYQPIKFDASDDEFTPCADKQDRMVLKDAVALDYRLKKFCDPSLIDKHQTQGICKADGAPVLNSIVGIFNEPGSHTWVFIPRTICLLALFVAFLVSCRILMQERRYNTLSVVTAMSKGTIRNLVLAKLSVAAFFAMLLTLLLMAFSAYQFGITIKPGILLALLPIAIGILSSGMLGLAAALVIRNEVTLYVVISIYLLMLFILSGYIDDLKTDDFFFAIFSYVLPLKFVLAPISSWMIFGNVPDLADVVDRNLYAQLLASVIILLGASEWHRRTQ